MTQNLKLAGWKEYNRKPSDAAELVNWQTYKNGSDRLVYFNSSSDFIECFKHNAIDNKFWDRPASSNTSWVFGKDYENLEDTIEAVENGRIMEKYIKKVEETKSRLYRSHPQLEELKQTSMLKKRRRKFSEDGDELDIDRYMSCDPAMWASCPPSDTRKKTARIYIDIWGSCGTNFQTFIDSIVFACAMADIIEASGVSLEIFVGTSASSLWIGDNYSTVAFPVKQANEPLDISRLLSFGITGVLRSMMFTTYDGMHMEKGATDYCGSYISSLERCKSLEPLDCDILMKGGDNCDSQDNVSMVVNKIKSVLNIN